MTKIFRLAIFFCSGEEFGHLELVAFCDFACGEQQVRLQIVVVNTRREDQNRKLCLRSFAQVSLCNVFPELLF